MCNRWCQRVLSSTILIIGLGLILGGGAHGRQSTQDDELQQAVRQAREVATSLAARIRGLLVKQLEQGDHVAAIKVCSEVAQQIPREFAERTGYSVRRVSLGYRNPEDIPDEYENRQLLQFDRLNREKKLEPEYVEVITDGGRRTLRYLKPLVAAPMCLACHGEKGAISPEVTRILAERYPQDRATGYRAGDVRGAISVKIALPEMK